jgi:hypothetical protein
MKNTDCEQQLNTENAVKVIKHYDVFPVKLSILEKQNNICPLCGDIISDTADAVLDHDHGSGLILKRILQEKDLATEWLKNLTYHMIDCLRTSTNLGLYPN